jgi:hypothetical protein
MKPIRYSLVHLILLVALAALTCAAVAERRAAFFSITWVALVMALVGSVIAAKPSRLFWLG